MAELWDVFDINRNYIKGRVSERGSDDMNDDEFHLVVFVIVANSKNELLVSLRDRNKMFGGQWEFCGGSAVSGETSRMAAERELLEETGLDVKDCDGEVITTRIKYWPGSNWFYDVWLIRSEFDETKLIPQPGEVEKIERHTVEWVREQIKINNFSGLTAEYLDVLEEKLKK